MKKIYTHPLRRVREQHNLTIEKLAEAAKLGAKTVWNAEHNHPVSAESRQRLCNYFHMTSLELGLISDDNETTREGSTSFFTRNSTSQMQHPDGTCRSLRSMQGRTASFTLDTFCSD